MARLLKENGLTIALTALFAVSLLAQALTGWKDDVGERAEHGLPPETLGDYVTSGDFVEAVAENWEGEFVQMAAFVWLTSFLFQKGSPESRDPHEPPESEPVTPESPWPVRRGGWVLRLYEYSLGGVLFLLFLVSFAGHLLGGWAEQNAEQRLHGEAAGTLLDYATSSRFWFESLQNWQSEFLSVGLVVWLAVYLRQRRSPESKPVHAPHAETGR